MRTRIHSQRNVCYSCHCGAQAPVWHYRPLVAEEGMMWKVGKLYLTPKLQYMWKKLNKQNNLNNPSITCNKLIVVKSFLKSTPDEMCWFLFKSYCLQTSTNQKTEWLKEDGIIDNNLECRQECRKNTKTQKWPKKKKKEEFCIYTHDLIRIYTNVVVSNKQ